MISFYNDFGIVLSDLNYFNKNYTPLPYALCHNWEFRKKNPLTSRGIINV